MIQENLGGKAPARTYQDLLSNEYDAATFEYYTTSQVVLVTLDGKVTELGKPGIVADAMPSPDGQYLLVETLHRPFSLHCPGQPLPLRSTVWDREGTIVYEVADLPLAESIPMAFGSVRTGRRSISWARRCRPHSLLGRSDGQR